MRTLEKNKRLIYYASYLGATPIIDDYGNETLEVTKTYSEPIKMKINYSANVGQDDTGVFGGFTEYDRIMTYIGKNPLKENDLVWLGIPITEKANYEVKKVADSLNSWVIAIKEII